MEREKATVWVTKYALTIGIFEKFGETLSEEQFEVFDHGCYYYLHKHEWHRTKEEAIARAEQMRKAKIASLKKQLEKLENLHFE